MIKKKDLEIKFAKNTTFIRCFLNEVFNQKNGPLKNSDKWIIIQNEKKEFQFFFLQKVAQNWSN